MLLAFIISNSMDSIKTNRTRRQRGYNFERELVNRINCSKGWKALRLGSPSVSLPDIIAVNNKESIILAIEAKSSSTNIIRVPLDQIARCYNILETFSLYKHRYAILALKFISKRWKRAYTYEQRGLREYYKLCEYVFDLGNCSSDDASIVCRYDGSLYYNNNGKSIPLILKDFTMPFNNATH